MLLWSFLGSLLVIGFLSEYLYGEDLFIGMVHLEKDLFGFP